MAGAIAEIARLTLANDFRRIDPRTASIVLVEAGPRVAAGVAGGALRLCAAGADALGVEVRTATRVTHCDADGVDLEDGRIDAGTVIWAAGVMASPAARWLAAGHDRAGRVSSATIYRCRASRRCSSSATPQRAANRRPPGSRRRPAAKQMGRYVGKLIAARPRGRRIAAVPLSRTPASSPPSAAGGRGRESAGFKLTGFIAWLFWSVAHIYFLIGLQQPLRRRLHLAVGLSHLSAARG